MDSKNLLTFLRSKNIHLTGQNNQLTVSAPQHVVTNELKELLRANKKVFCDYLNINGHRWFDSVCIHHYFEAYAEFMPNATAVVFGNEEVTYGQLNAKADIIASYLIDTNVSVESLVGLYFEPSIDLIASIIGVLKAKAAYVPLDPNAPRERTSYIIEDSNLEIVLSDENLKQKLTNLSVTCVSMSDVQSRDINHNVTDDKHKLTLQNLAYIVYTSGSTGTPKGVAVTHQNVVRLFDTTRTWLGFNDSDIWSLFHSYSFDFSVWEMWGALAHGGKLIVVPYTIARSPEDFFALLCEQQVTVLNQTPSAFQQLIKADQELGGQDRQLALRYVIFGGEALLLENLRPWFVRYGDNKPVLVNMYGITEITVHASLRKITFSDLEQAKGSVIGTSLPDLTFHLLDESMQPVPEGDVGELYISGPGVARGYLGKSDLTADRYLPNPFSQIAGDRLYRSGDTARYLGGGEFEYIGRIDEQVKIRGFRIELQEVRLTILKHPMIANAVVTTYERDTDDHELVAYLILNEDVTNLAQTMRSFLKTLLPDYMIPAEFIQIDIVPITNNGKINYRQLPSPDKQPDNINIIEETSLASSDMQRALVQLWQKVLGIAHVSIHDNFFEVGGDSILAIQLASRARQSGIYFTPKQLFEKQTVAELSSVVSVDKAIDVIEKPVFGTAKLTPVQSWFFTQDFYCQQHWNQALLLRTEQAISEDKLNALIKDLVCHHDGLRHKFSYESGGFVQSCVDICEFNSPFVYYYDLTYETDGEKIAKRDALIEQLQASFDLTDGPLFKVAFFNLDERHGNYYFFVAHHLVIDAVSWRILIEDFSILFDHYRDNKANKLPEKTSSYLSWADQYYQFSSELVIEQELNYWCNLPWSKVVPLVTDYVGNDNLEGDTEAEYIKFSKEITQRLLARCSSLQVSIQEVLLLTLSCSILTDDEGVLLVDLEHHGRQAFDEQLDVSRTVGWFTTIYPVLLTQPKGNSRADSLQAVKIQLSDVPNHGIGYGVLRYLMNNEQLARLPRAEVCFNYLGHIASNSSQLFELDTDLDGIRSDKAKRPYLLEVAASIIDGELKLVWHYGKMQYRTLTIQKICERFRRVLEDLSSLDIANAITVKSNKPKTDTEQLVTGIYSELTGIPTVVPDDDFFALGGQVTLLTQLVSRIRQKTGVNIPMREIYRLRIMRDIATFIDEQKDMQSNQSLLISDVFDRYPIPKLPKLPYYHVSPFQLPELFFNSFAPDSPMYNILSCDIVLVGDFNVDAACKALSLIEKQQAIFRTRFASHQGELVQYVVPPREINPEDILLDFTNIDEEDYIDVSTKLAHEYASRSLDFNNGPIFHIKFASFPGNKYLLLLLTNHVVWDEVSMLNFSSKFRELYNRITHGEKVDELPELEITYFDYAHWILDLVNRGVLDDQKNYWINQFADRPAPLEFPIDFPRPALQTFNGSDVSGKLPRTVVSKLFKYLSESKKNVTLSNFLLSLLGLLFYRITGQADIIIGMPFSNRLDLPIEKIMGPFAVALPIRIRVSADMTFTELLAQTQQVTMEALENSLYPGIMAIQGINPDWDMSKTRLYPVMYGLQHNKSKLWTDLKLNGLTAERAEHLQTIGPLHSSARCDLRVLMDHLFDDILFSFSYNSDIFLRSSIERMTQQFISLVGQVLDGGDRTLKDYVMLSADEKTQLIDKFNQSYWKAEDFSPIHKRFEQNVTTAPDAPAIYHKGFEWTYTQLNDYSNMLAYYLRTLNLPAETVIAVYMQKCPEMIGTILAIIKAGYVFLPMDATLPDERIKVILTEANVKTVVTKGSTTARLTAMNEDFHIVYLDTVSFDTLPSGATNNPDLACHPRQLAYLIYTSGSTGVPKGVMIEHAGIENRIHVSGKVHPIMPDDVVFQFTSMSFDVSILEIFLALYYGAKLVIPECHHVANMHYLVDLIKETGTTFVNFTPSLLQILADVPQLEACTALRYIHSGGEALPNNLPPKFYAKLPQVQVYNFYGPTEISVDALYYNCENESPLRFMPIGHPIINMKAYVLNEYLSIQPIGVPGELYIGGIGLARGYHQRPDSTAVSFIPNKYADQPGELLYKTGDRARVLGDGSIEFLGRVDRQVKVRGNRVELDEIEAKLNAHPAVKLSTVRYLSNLNTSGDSLLLAYIELQDTINKYASKDEVFRAFSLAIRPDLKSAVDHLHRQSWPDYFMGDVIMREYWPRLYQDFADYQLALVDEHDQLVAVANAIPIYWDGTQQGLPCGWDGGIKLGVELKATEQSTNTLLLLAAVVDRNHAGKGLSGMLLKVMKAVAKEHQFRCLIAPVRPTGKINFPQLSFADYCDLKRDDGLALDNWIRTHQRLGAEVVGLELASQSVIATIDEWQKWTGDQLTASGRFASSETLQPILVDIQQDLVEYRDPCIWIEHPLTLANDFTYAHINADILVDYLKVSLPQYMVPQLYRFMLKIPLMSSGKINVELLPDLSNIETNRKIVPPVTIIQTELVGLWKTLLDLDAVSIKDNFFYIGGHSIKAMQLVAHIKDRYGVDIRLKDLFIEPTIEALEKRILSEQSTYVMQDLMMH